jgi:hypothetical protein
MFKQKTCISVYLALNVVKIVTETLTSTGKCSVKDYIALFISLNIGGNKNECKN